MMINPLPLLNHCEDKRVTGIEFTSEEVHDLTLSVLVAVIFIFVNYLMFWNEPYIIKAVYN
jgi:hypothetical protein